MSTIDDADYRNLVQALLARVRRTNEKSYVHGRFLKPTSAVGRGNDKGDQKGRRQKRVTFFSVPFFSVKKPRIEKTDKHYDGYPVRSLMQSIYRLESTRQRDSYQVLAKRGGSGGVVHVPEFWALVIGKRKRTAVATRPSH